MARPGCAQPRRDGAQGDGAYDPLEGFNRRIFAFNNWLGIRSTGTEGGGAAAPTQAGLLPAVMRGQISSMSANIQEPVSVAIDLAAGDLDWAANGATRFVLNTTLGVLGTRDVATGMGYPATHTDAGLALCRAGVLADPPYLVMPLAGPTNVRDLGGQILTNVGVWQALGVPLFYGYYALTRLEAALLRVQASAPADAGDADAAADDPYVAQRDAALGRRAQLCATAQ